ncbi:hypothetical protein C8R43DRAFT_1119706 [Mycena crocata]|nr:hypothetical protein C8R43DRAFT_1119706 [Mycena crocata]
MAQSSTKGSRHNPLFIDDKGSRLDPHVLDDPEFDSIQVARNRRYPDVILGPPSILLEPSIRAERQRAVAERMRQIELDLEVEAGVQEARRKRYIGPNATTCVVADGRKRASRHRENMVPAAPPPLAMRRRFIGAQSAGKREVRDAPLTHTDLWVDAFACMRSLTLYLTCVVIAIAMAPFRQWAEEASITYAYPQWNDPSHVDYSWDGLLFPRPERKMLMPSSR